MPTIVLQHCVPVRVYPVQGDTPPQNINVNLSGGNPGDGSIDVHSPGPIGPVVGTSPTGASLSVPVPGATDVWIHFMQSPGGPMTTEIEYDVQTR
jgi:hypothetical protein